jgi:hypothetical protein
MTEIRTRFEKVYNWLLENREYTKKINNTDTLNSIGTLIATKRIGVSK